MITQSHALLTRYARLTEWSGLSLDQNWLSHQEREECDRWRTPERRQMWLAGRWVAKQLIRQNLPDTSTHAGEITILSTNDQKRSVRPSIQIREQPQTDWCLSITHSQRGVLVALAQGSNIKVGIDICEPHSFPASFQNTWFTPREQAAFAMGIPELVRRTWTAKEAIYKAVNQGEPFAPRQIEISWAASSIVCRYGDYIFGDELVLNTWTVDNQIAVSAVFTGLEKSRDRFQTNPFFQEYSS